MYKKSSRLVAGILILMLVLSSLPLRPMEAKAYASSPKLDNRVIFQSFSLYQPYESNMYKKLSSQGKLLKDWGVTDIWLPPAYRSFGIARYMEGYAIADRYDLGEFAQGPNNEKATKYGTSDELKSLVNTLHSNSLKVQMDLVPNQMMGLNQREALWVKRVDGDGDLFKNPYTTDKYSDIRGDLYFAYTKGGGQGQAKYGFIKEWNKKYFNGSSLQNQGMNRVMSDDNGKPYRFFGPKDANNYLPEWLKEAAEANKINTIDSYLSIDGWYAAKEASQSDNYWKPMLINYTKDAAYLNYMKEHGFASVEDIINGNNGDIAKLTDVYIASSPSYNNKSEQKSYQNDKSGIDGNDQLLFVDEDGKQIHSINNTIGKSNEFLVGNDIDNSHPTVQKEQINWMRWLLNTYKFDGFRIDAASHYDTQVLLDEADVKKDIYGSDLDNHISYIESYSSNQLPYVKSNKYPQLTMDYSLYYTFQNSLAKGTNRQKLQTLATNSVVNRNGSGKANATPNWSFTNNHDQEKNRVNTIMLDLYGIKPNQKYGTATPKSFEDLYDKETENKALKIYAEDMKKVDKKYTMNNLVSQYAYLLTNKDTVPTVYYGDLFKTDGSYMNEKTNYYEPITKLLKARKAYAYGNQTVTSYATNTSPKTTGQDLISSVRFGKDRYTGMATVIGNNAKINKVIKVNMGSQHKNQVFTDVTGFNKTKLVTDSKGILTIPVKGVKNANVDGYLGVWVPTKDKAPSISWKNTKSVYQGTTVKMLPQLSNATSKGSTVTYTTSNKDIITVDKYGNVKGNKKTGSATISATMTTKDQFILFSSVSMSNKVNSVTLKANSATLKRGKATTIGVKSSTDKIKSVTYKTSNKKVATVNSKGQVKAVNYGKATVTATYKTRGEYNVTKKFAVTVKK